MSRKVSTLAVLIVALALPSFAHAEAKPSWCNGGPGAICDAADDALSSQLLNGTRPYEEAWESGFYKTLGISSNDDPDCYAFDDEGPVQCFAFYAYMGRYYFVSASVNAGQATQGKAHIYDVESYRRRWVTCPLGKDVQGHHVPGRLISRAITECCGRP